MGNACEQLAELRNEYENRITSLEQDVERLQNEKQTLIADRQEKQALVEYVEREQSLSERKAHAGDCYAREVVAHRDVQRRRITD